MKKDYKKLELDKVLALLANEAWSEQCREKILEIEPKYTLREINEEIKKTDDAFVLSSKFGTPRFSRIKDVRGGVKRAQNGGGLSLRELLDVCNVLKEIGALSSWYSQCENIENSLAELFGGLVPNKHLAEKIDNAIISEEEISDNASAELSAIRKAIIRQSARIKEQLDKIIRNQSKYLQESLVTQRDGRYVVPVKSEYKGEVSGLVHDTSSSGATFFIEPMSVVEANNEIRVLKSREQAEMERIVGELSSDVGIIAESLIYSYETAIELEVYFAKSNLGARLKCSTPIIVDEPIIDLKRARHPLIKKETVVPVSLSLGEKYSCLVVTGPNTGGKTVSIKTAGLLALMAMCGMMIPADDGSRIGVFTKILADIGDEQSIEQSLSTFSSHITNIVEILRVADEKSLVLLDELGSGTDPIEGAALAVSVLKRLKNNGSRIIATTHYQEVKLFAIETDGVENACCEFNVETLMPTYKLIVGVPGKSNAFAIATRLGIDDGVISEAKELVSTENKRFEEVVEQLENSRQELEETKRSIDAERLRSKMLVEKLEKQQAEFEAEKEKEMANARQRAMSIVEQVRFGSDKLMEELEALRKEKDKADFSEKVKAAGGKINSTVKKLYDTANPVEEKKLKPYKLPRPLKVHDTVLLADIDKKGSLLSLPDASGVCFVQVGLIKTKTNKDNLRLVENEERVKLNGKAIPTFKKTVQSNLTRSSGMECDIRGMMSDDGIMAVDQFLDGAILSGLHVVTIIHGKGTGALRAAVHQFLRRSKHVKSFRLGEYGEGDAGVTVVELQ